MNTGSGLHCKFFSNMISFYFLFMCVQIWLPHLPHEAQPGEGVRAAVQQLGPLRAQGDCQGQGCWGQGQVRPHAPKSGDFLMEEGIEGIVCVLSFVHWFRWQWTCSSMRTSQARSKWSLGWTSEGRLLQVSAFFPENEIKWVHFFQKRTIRKTRSSLLKALNLIFWLKTS